MVTRMTPAPDETAGQHSRLTRRVLLGAGAAVLGPAAAWPAVLLQPAGEGAVLTVPLGRAPGGFTVFALEGPPRLVIDLPGFIWSGAEPGGLGPVQRLRHGANQPGVGRIVLDLDQPVALRRAEVVPALDGAASAGAQLVVEIAPGPAERFRRILVTRAAAPAAVPAAAPAAQPPATIAPSGAPPSTAARAPAAKPAAPPEGRVARIAQPPLVVVLDPGHGGKDPGTIGITGIHEKVITLATAQELARRLSARPGVTVHMTRTGDVFVPLADRVRFAQARQADLFLSLHADAADSRAVRGASVYTLALEASDEFAAALARRENAADQVAGPHFTGVSPEVARILFSLVRRETLNGAAALATEVVEGLGRATTLLPNTHRQAAFVVLKAPDVPSALVELGFLSNRGDEAKLREAGHRGRLAGALAEAVMSYGASRRVPATAVAGSP